MTTTTSITAEIVAALEDDGWTTPHNWKNVNNVREDEYGNSVSIHEQDETVRIEFEYALPGGCVELLHLSPAWGGHRIAGVIAALAAPEL
ncbi:MAG: hypothetical protein K0U84_18580 [Actinomycetia bacterium]|nr:hypothetical protein [Actinomycetes bacterium]